MKQRWIHGLLSAAFITMFFVCTTVVAAQKKPGGKRKAPAKTSDKLCASFVEKTARATIRSMGLKDGVGFQLEEEAMPGGAKKDSEGNLLVRYATGALIRDEGGEENEGFIPDSGIQATIRQRDGKCEIVNLEISLGNF